tara:strand:- start:244 stop:423 length:180 start_codon:yes stop_codon:yes gene_type:complete
VPEVQFTELTFIQQLVILKEVAEQFEREGDPLMASELIYMIKNIELPEIITSGEIVGEA